MCADKLRRVWPVSVDWTSGEMPTSTKLQGFSTQTSNALRVVEKAVGDLWNSSGDTLMDDWPLRIPNLARILGPARYSSSPILGGGTSAFSHVEDLTQHVGKNVFCLKYKPSTTPTGTPNIFSPTTGISNWVASPSLVLAANDYHIDADGKVTVFTALATGVTATYSIFLSSDGFKKQDGAEGTLAYGANIIPTRLQRDGTVFQGLKYTYFDATGASGGTDNGSYMLWLPPIVKLEDVDGHSYKESTPDPGTTPVWAPALTSGNKAADGTKYYHDGTQDAQAGSRRYVLPVEVNALADTTQIPDGMLFIYDETSATVIEGVKFYSTGASTSYKIKAVMPTGVSLNAGEKTTLSTTETSAAYATRYSLICISQSVAHIAHEALSTVRTHQHKGYNLDGSARINHSDLAGLVSDALNDATWDPPTTAPAFTHSKWHFDEHSQYLHRWGYDGTNDRDQYKNAMLGDFVMSSSSSATNYLNTSADSRGILFGSGSGPKIYRDNTAGGLAIKDSDLYFANSPSAKRIKYKTSVTSDYALGKIIIPPANAVAITTNDWAPAFHSGGAFAFQLKKKLSNSLRVPVILPSGTGSNLGVENVTVYIAVDGTTATGTLSTAAIQAEFRQSEINSDTDTITESVIGSSTLGFDGSGNLAVGVYEFSVYNTAVFVATPKINGNTVYSYMVDFVGTNNITNDTQAQKFYYLGTRVEFRYNTLEL